MMEMIGHVHDIDKIYKLSVKILIVKLFLFSNKDISLLPKMY